MYNPETTKFWKGIKFYTTDVCGIQENRGEPTEITWNVSKNWWKLAVLVKFLKMTCKKAPKEVSNTIRRGNWGLNFENWIYVSSENM